MDLPKGTQVRRADNPGRVGQLTGKTRERGALKFFGISWSDGSTDYVPEDQLEVISESLSRDPFELIEAGRYGRSSDFRRNLTHVHLSGRLANLVYSMGITNTDFYPHQYKPLLTLLESPADGLLIADEVGLGKTIEAGLIWTELRAREDLRRLLIVCPAMLREKWRDELRLRFGIDAEIVEAKGLTQALGDAKESRAPVALVASYQSLRPPRGWRPGAEQAGKKPNSRVRLASFLEERGEDEPLIDLVIFDEAHYMRNPDSAVNRLAQLLLGVTQYRVLLSATPINLHNADLFQLLQLCDPENFQYQSSFQQMIEANQPLVAARDAALNPKSTADQIINLARAAYATPLLSNSRQLANVVNSPPTDADLASPAFRSELAAAFERINLLGHVITRTRKRDVQEHRPIRDVKSEKIEMTEAERRFYQYVTDVTRDYAWRRDLSDGFLLATPQRQVCSCPAAFARAWLGDDETLVEDMVDQIAEEDEADGIEEFDLDINQTLKQFLTLNRPRELTAADLEKSDSKLTRLLTELERYFKNEPSEKVILFTSFRITARYLKERLDQSMMPSILLMGGMVESKQGVINEFRDSSKLKVLIATEVASEGVDLQFCRLLINYDLPWNPMRVEQRIGRIDRLGQKAKVISIWNLFYESTIDERIFNRLLGRLKIFEQALGEPEPIIGETIKKLENILITKRLSPEEEEVEIERATLALENVRIRQEELEKSAATMMAHGGLVLQRIQAADELSRRVTEQDLLIYVSDYLNQNAPGHQFQQLGDGKTYSIQLPPETAADLGAYCKRKGLAGQTALVSGMPKHCQFVNKIAHASGKPYEVIHQFHPLVRMISEKLDQAKEAFYPLVSISVDKKHLRLTPGIYVVSIRRWSFGGVRVEEWLQAAAKNLSGGAVLSDDETDRLLNVARLHGRDWLDAPACVLSELVAECLDDLESHLEITYQRLKSRKQDENSDRVSFQLNGLEQFEWTRLQSLESVLSRHVSNNRTNLVKATRGRIEKLKIRVATKQEQIRRNESVIVDNSSICAGLIQVT